MFADLMLTLLVMGFASTVLGAAHVLDMRMNSSLKDTGQAPQASALIIKGKHPIVLLWNYGVRNLTYFLVIEGELKGGGEIPPDSYEVLQMPEEVNDSEVLLLINGEVLLNPEVIVP